jgi:pyruvate/2-oxoglutarate dehydrogenase complex dihydrolipoamide dehydrogenase (E3) component
LATRTVAVLGGGSAGFTAARTAAKHGARVLFFMGDNADMASLCVNRGCMPSKAMFQPIDTMHHARKQRWLRVEPIQPEAYLGQIVAWKDHEHTVHNSASAEYYHPTQIELVAEIFDRMCKRLGGAPPRRADETTG